MYQTSITIKSRMRKDKLIGCTGRQACVNIGGISPNYAPHPSYQAPNQYLLSALFCLNTTRTISTYRSFKAKIYSKLVV